MPVPVRRKNTILKRHNRWLHNKPEKYRQKEETGSCNMLQHCKSSYVTFKKCILNCWFKKFDLFPVKSVKDIKIFRSYTIKHGELLDFQADTIEIGDAFTPPGDCGITVFQHKQALHTDTKAHPTVMYPPFGIKRMWTYGT